MIQLASLATGAIVGFALVFLGPPGLALGFMAAVAYAAVVSERHTLERVGAALVGGGLVAAVIAGRTVLLAFA